MPLRVSIAAAGLVVASVTPAAAQSPVTWRVRFTGEASGDRANASSVFAAQGDAPAWDASNQALATGDVTWEPRRRLKAGAGVALRAQVHASTTLRVREAYARVSATPWLDVEGGKRLTRWGTGYAFTPTGLVDPPRDATDPQDRLGLNEGMVLVRADVFRGASALTIAMAAPHVNRPTAMSAPHRLAAIRARTTVGGVDIALVASAADDRVASFGANFTHVVGRQLEYHGEVLSHQATSAWLQVLDPAASPTRTVSALVGLQYTFQAGVNVVVEYYRDGNGLSKPLWNRLVDSAEARSAPAPRVDARADDVTLSLPSDRPTRQQFFFARASRANANARVAPELITLVGLEDGGITLVPTVTLSLTEHVQPYVRSVRLAGPARSEAGNATTGVLVSAGVTVRF